MLKTITNVLKGTKFGSYLRRKKLNKKLFNEKEIDKSISKYMGEISSQKREELKKDILDMAKKYRFGAEEYFCYHFYNLPERDRKTFISDLNRIDFCDKLNKAKNLDIFFDKGKSAKVFGDYYGRDICIVRKKSDISKLKTFVEKHNKFIIKPMTGSCGRGIKIVQDDWNEEKLNNLIAEYISGKNSGCIIEEILVQVDELAQFHPGSLNTIRVATVKFDEGTEVIAAFFRTGRGGSIVDNAGAGGVFGTIDVQSGIIDAVGDEYGNTYKTHPDSGIALEGFEIPQWEQAKEMAKELANVVKGNRYAGWDLALTEKGWVMIEGNARGQMIWQMPRQKGFLAEANHILNRLGLEEMKKLSI